MKPYRPHVPSSLSPGSEGLLHAGWEAEVMQGLCSTESHHIEHFLWNLSCPFHIWDFVICDRCSKWQGTILNSSGKQAPFYSSAYKVSGWFQFLTCQRELPSQYFPRPRWDTNFD